MHQQTCQADSRPFPLAMADEGSQVRITDLVGGQRFKTRLTSMGLNNGSQLEVVLRMGGKTVVRRGECKLALGAGMAHKVMVVAAENSNDNSSK